MGAAPGSDIFGGLVEDVKTLLSQLPVRRKKPVPVKSAVVEPLRADGRIQGDLRFLFRGKGLVDMGLEKPDALLQPRPAQDLLRKARPLGRVHGRLRQALFPDVRGGKQLLQLLRAVLLRRITALQQTAEHGPLGGIRRIEIAPEKGLLSQRRQKTAEILRPFKPFDGTGGRRERGGKLSPLLFHLHDAPHRGAGYLLRPVPGLQKPLSSAVKLRRRGEHADIPGCVASHKQPLIQRLRRKQLLFAGAEKIFRLQSLLHRRLHLPLQRVLEPEPGPEVLRPFGRFLQNAPPEAGHPVVERKIIPSSLPDDSLFLIGLQIFPAEIFPADQLHRAPVAAKGCGEYFFRRKDLYKKGGHIHHLPVARLIDAIGRSVIIGREPALRIREPGLRRCPVHIGAVPAAGSIAEPKHFFRI